MVTNLIRVISLKERHMGVSEEQRKEISALIQKLGKHTFKDTTQHQIKMLQSRIKSMPESGRRDFDGYQTHIARARVDLIQSIVVSMKYRCRRRLYNFFRKTARRWSYKWS